MKKLFFISLVLLMALSCKKVTKSPEGPADIRIKNLSDQTFDSLKVNTSGGEYNYGSLAAGQYTRYHRYEKAYPKADISVMINGQTYKTDKVDYTYAVVLGQGKFTYEVWISVPASKKIAIWQVIPDAPLDSLR
jgi:hypothetical protein